MAVEVRKLNNNNHPDGTSTYDEATGISVSEGVLFVKNGASNVAIYQAGFWISAEKK